MADQEQNRSEAATPHKLKEAQKRGQTAKSQEAGFAVVLAALVLVLYAAGSGMARRLLELDQMLFLQAGRSDWSAAAMLAWLSAVGAAALQALAPLLAALVLAAILGNMVQVGPMLSIKALTPDFERINPAAGLKRLFSLRLVYEAGKSALKLVVLGAVLWVALRHLLPLMLHLGQVDPRGHAGVVMGAVAPLLVKLLLVLLIIAILDSGYARWDFARKMRMSRREVTEEHKQREGDPRIRSRLRQLRLDMLRQSRAVRDLPGADVLLTNPTHLAVAISYQHGSMPAPKLLAKGAGEVAAKMREAARRHRIPIVENRPLARALFKRVDFDGYVPEDLYPQLAKILLWVYAMRQRAAAGAAA
jgi:flagellar biosynthetic protein FlhB